MKKNKQIIPCLILISIFSFLSAQAPDTLWTRFYGIGNDEWASDVLETPDSGYLVLGTIEYNFPYGDIYLIKTDKSGNLLWDRTYGSPGWEEGISLAPTPDGAYIIAGYTDSLAPSDTDDVLLIKIDSMGNTLWAKTYDLGAYEQVRDIQNTSDSGYIVTGLTSASGATADVFLLRIDSNGNSLWAKTFHRGDWDEGQSVQETPDKGFIIGAYTGDWFNSDIWIIRTDRSGDTLWDTVIGLPSYNEMIRSVQLTFDGNYIVVGGKEINWPNVDVWLIKINNNGDTLWTRRYGGANLDNGYDVLQMPDSGYVIAGLTWSYGNGLRDVYVIRTDKNGDTLWTKTVGGDSSDGARAIQLTSDSSFIIAGETKSYGSGNWDFYLVKLRSYVEIEEKFSFIRNRQKNTLILPQGSFFSDRITLNIAYPAVSWRADNIPLKIVLNNVLGNSVFESVINHTATITISGEKISKLPSGVYFLSVYSGKRKIGQVKLIHPVK